MSYGVTPLRLDEHRDVVARLWSESMSDTGIASVVPRRLRWLYEEGPEGAPKTLLCKLEGSGEVIGCASFLPRTLRVDGRSLSAAVLCDFAVSKAHRVLGPAVVLQRGLVEAARAAGIELLYGYPNAKSLPVFQRIGYRVVGTTTSWVKPLGATDRLRSRLGEMGARAAALPLDGALALTDALRWFGPGMRARGEVSEHPVEGVERLWSAVRDGYGIAGERSSAYLEWRYARFPTVEHRFFAAHGAGGELQGCAVVSLERPKAVLRDLFVDGGATREAALLLALSRRLRREGVESLLVSYLGMPRFTRELRAAGFFRRRDSSRPLVVHPDLVPAALRARVFDPASWYMLDGELDI